MKKNDIPKRIIDALENLGPSSPRQLLDQIGGSESKIGYHLRKLLTAKALKAAGTSMDRVYALPGQKLEGAQRIAAKPDKSAPAKALAAPIAALTTDRRIVVTSTDKRGMVTATVLAAEFTDPIAQLLKKAA